MEYDVTDWRRWLSRVNLAVMWNLQSAWKWAANSYSQKHFEFRWGYHYLIGWLYWICGRLIGFSLQKKCIRGCWIFIWIDKFYNLIFSHWACYDILTLTEPITVFLQCKHTHDHFACQLRWLPSACVWTQVRPSSCKI